MQFCLFCFTVLSDQELKLEVVEGSESVILPCKTIPDLPEDTTVEWARFDREIMMVHEYSNGTDQLKNQDDRYCDRTKMNKDLLRTGDLSLTLIYPTERDSGGYICTIYRDKDIQKQKVVLQVKGQTCQSPKMMLFLYFSTEQFFQRQQMIIQQPFSESFK
uniref:Ig-like domain-containing protein n=1 Tax=Oreochromis niloticus TaxID=8128 RepID=A0A669F6S5_ORENI